MTRRVLAWLGAVVVVGSVASALSAQVQRPVPRVVTGPDLGFRVDGSDRNGRPTGTMVVRVNGEWVEVGSKMSVRPAHEP